MVTSNMSAPAPDEGTAAEAFKSSTVVHPSVEVSGEISLTIDLRVYRLSAVQKTGYRLASKCTVALGCIEGDLLAVTLLFPDRGTLVDREATRRLFFQELLDQELREKVGDQTSQLRTLLLANAFSKTGLASGG